MSNFVKEKPRSWNSWNQKTSKALQVLFGDVTASQDDVESFGCILTIKSNLLNSIMRLKFRISFNKTGKYTGLWWIPCNPLYSFPFRQGASTKRSRCKCKTFKVQVQNVQDASAKHSRCKCKTFNVQVRNVQGASKWVNVNILNKKFP